MKRINISSRISFFIFLVQFVATGVVNAQVPKEYKGKPYQDSLYQKGPQAIPGVMELGYYDLGGEGVANCPESGKLKVPTNICHFREKEGVDVSYTRDMADFSHPNLFEHL